jgi:hypothetical protein
LPLVDRELRLIAHRYMRWERPGHTLQTSPLVNEAYLRRIAPLHRFGNILLGVFTPAVGNQARNKRKEIRFGTHNVAKATL